SSSRHPVSTPVPHPLSLHDALPISTSPIPMSTASTAETRAWVRMKPLSVFHERVATSVTCAPARAPETRRTKGRKSGPSLRKKRSEEHTSELQSRFDLVCRLLLEKK